MNCSDNYDESNAIGNGEVDSSILSGSTSFFNEINYRRENELINWRRALACVCRTKHEIACTFVQNPCLVSGCSHEKKRPQRGGRAEAVRGTAPAGGYGGAVL
jgi:hypothetical protein